MMAQLFIKFGCCNFVSLSCICKWLFSWFLLLWEVSKNSLPLPLILIETIMGPILVCNGGWYCRNRSSVALADRMVLFVPRQFLSLQFTGILPGTWLAFWSERKQITHKFIYRLHLFSTSWHVFLFPLEAHIGLFTLTSVSTLRHYYRCASQENGVA